MLKPICDKIVIELDPKTDKVGSIYMAMGREKRESKGTVIDVGSTVKNCKVGDVIAFEHGQFRPLSVDNDREFAIVLDEHVIGIFEDDKDAE